MIIDIVNTGFMKNLAFMRKARAIWWYGVAHFNCENPIMFITGHLYFEYFMGFGSRNCWRCDGKKPIKKFIRYNSLVCTCLNCNWQYAIDLIKIKKKIIYLDQNFFSNAYKRKDERFAKIADKLSVLSKNKLLFVHFQKCTTKKLIFTKNELSCGIL